MWAWNEAVEEEARGESGECASASGPSIYEDKGDGIMDSSQSIYLHV